MLAMVKRLDKRTRDNCGKVSKEAHPNSGSDLSSASKVRVC